jgi:hypothetical protein
MDVCRCKAASGSMTYPNLMVEPDVMTNMSIVGVRRNVKRWIATRRYSDECRIDQRK